MAATIGLTVLHIVLSILVTMHVLLRKRDIGSSIGWIGLAWLSPFLGSAAYFLLGVNRVRQRARTLKRPRGNGNGEAGPAPASALPDEDALAFIDRTAHRLTRRRAAPGNALTPLHNGDEAYPRMLTAIDAAVADIGLSSYILRDDEAGGPIIDGLIRAHRRGVAVHVLIDGIGSGYLWSPAYRRLHSAGVPVARFMHSPLPWNMPFLNLRSHKKILVIDGRIGFAGGLNIGRENLLRSSPPNPVRDTHFTLCGPIVSQLAEAFARDWRFVTGGELPARDPGPPGAGSAAARVVTSGPDQDLEKIEFVALQAITCARRSVRIMTPYFLPDERLVTALALAAMRGVEVDIIVPERSNYRFVDWGMRAHVGPLLAAGCRIWYSPPPFDHSKLMVVDGGWSLIGSSNWDMRSLRLNFELDVEIYDAAVAEAMTEVMLGKRGRRLGAAELAQRPLPIRLRDAMMRLLLPYI